jgi:hypothetical protein
MSVTPEAHPEHTRLMPSAHRPLMSLHQFIKFPSVDSKTTDMSKHSERRRRSVFRLDTHWH